MIAVVAIAQSLGLLVVGGELPMEDLRRLTAGKVLIPLLQQRRRGRWHPEDLIRPHAGQDSAWRQARWQGALDYLRQSGIDEADVLEAPGDGRAKRS